MDDNWQSIGSIAAKVLAKHQIKCRCLAELTKCDHTNKLCPASSYRLVLDTDAAMQDLFNFAAADKVETGV